jgi:hypothetical protein
LVSDSTAIKIALLTELDPAPTKLSEFDPY